MMWARDHQYVKEIPRLFLVSCTSLRPRCRDSSDNSELQSKTVGQPEEGEKYTEEKMK